MKILFLSHSFNSLSQRLWVELSRLGHELSMELDINDQVTIEAAKLFQPDLIIAPFLKRAIPPQLWQHYRCIIIHPGIVGDRGPSALDWAISNDLDEWGVTALQADAEMDAGDIWAESRFKMRRARKSSLYHNEVTEAAVQALHQTLRQIEAGDYKATPLDYSNPNVKGKWQASMTQQSRSIDWQTESSAQILQKLYAADSFPGVLDELFGEPYYLFDAHPETELKGPPGEIIAKRDNAICRATVDGAIWIGQLKKRGEYKLPATQLLASKLDGVATATLGLDCGLRNDSYQEIGYEQKNNIGFLYFDFYNGAMSTTQCIRLRQVYEYACSRDTKAIVLMGGEEFWSNGINLNTIEAAESAPEESWQNINAMNDLCHRIITTNDKITVAAMRGNASAGGLFMALAADYIFARNGIVLNPHYKNMGNLYGSEYWTYLLPKRVGQTNIAKIMGQRLPIGAPEAQQFGLIDASFGDSLNEFQQQLQLRLADFLEQPDYDALLKQKRTKRQSDEANKPLAHYRDEEMARMRLNFFGFDPSYHVARHEFVYKTLPARTPLHLARHRAR